MATYQAEVLADSPLVYNKLAGGDSTAILTDSSGNSRPATAVTGTLNYLQPALLSSVTADPSCGFNTSGLSWSNAAWMNATSITIEAWINYTNIGGSQTPVIWDRDQSGGRSFRLQVDANGTLALIFWTSGGGPFFLNSSATLSNNITYHIAATYASATGIATLYINGAAAGTSTVAANPLASTNSALRMGYSHAGTSSPVAVTYAGGRIDEAALYGTALSAARILAHYSAQSDTGPATGPATALHSQQVETLATADGKLYSQSTDVVALAPGALYSQSTDVVAHLDQRSRLSSLWADAVLSADHRSRVHSVWADVVIVPTVTQRVDALEVAVLSVPAPPVQSASSFEVAVLSSMALAAPSNDLWVWNGTAEVPAYVTVWNGTAEVAAGVEVT